MVPEDPSEPIIRLPNGACMGNVCKPMSKPSSNNRTLHAGRTAALLCVWLGLGGAGAPPESSVPIEKPIKPDKALHVKTSLICDQTGAVPGTTVTLGVSFKIQPKWHMYWHGRNDSGLPPTIEFDLPTGYTVDALRWPTPVRNIEPGELLNHVYFDSLTLLTTLHIPASAKPESTDAIKARLSWMVCNESCFGEQAQVSLKLPIISSMDRPHRSDDAKAIDEARARVPRELPKDTRDVQIQWLPSGVSISSLAATRMTFFPYEDCVPLADAIKDADAARSSLILRLGDPDGERTALAGVLEVRRGSDTPDFYIIQSSPGAAPATPGPALRPTDLPQTPRRPPVDPKPYP